MVPRTAALGAYLRLRIEGGSSPQPAASAKRTMSVRIVGQCNTGSAQERDGKSGEALGERQAVSSRLDAAAAHDIRERADQIGGEAELAVPADGSAAFVEQLQAQPRHHADHATIFVATGERDHVV